MSENLSFFGKITPDDNHCIFIFFFDGCLSDIAYNNIKKSWKEISKNICPDSKLMILEDGFKPVMIKGDDSIINPLLSKLDEINSNLIDIENSIEGIHRL